MSSQFRKKLAQLGLTDEECIESEFMDEVMQAAIRLGIDYQRAFYLLGALAKVVAQSHAELPFAQARAELLQLFTDGLDEPDGESIAVELGDEVAP